MPMPNNGMEMSNLFLLKKRVASTVKTININPNNIRMVTAIFGFLKHKSVFVAPSRRNYEKF